MLQKVFYSGISLVMGGIVAKGVDQSNALGFLPNAAQEHVEPMNKKIAVFSSTQMIKLGFLAHVIQIPVAALGRSYKSFRAVAALTKAIALSCFFSVGVILTTRIDVVRKGILKTKRDLENKAPEIHAQLAVYAQQKKAILEVKAQLGPVKDQITKNPRTYQVVSYLFPGKSVNVSEVDKTIADLSTKITAIEKEEAELKKLLANVTAAQENLKEILESGIYFIFYVLRNSKKPSIHKLLH